MMAISGLSGSYSLTEAAIDKYVTKISAGTYALGRTKEKTFYISHVGRADDDVNGRLKDHVGAYERFKFGYFPSARAAFEKECTLYHDFGGPQGKLDNKIHPATPPNSHWPCPRGCGR
jgi:hypothetical protein